MSLLNCARPAPESSAGRGRERIFNGPVDQSHGPLTEVHRIIVFMGDFLSVVGFIAFAAAMLGMIWALERV